MTRKLNYALLVRRIVAAAVNSKRTEISVPWIVMKFNVGMSAAKLIRRYLEDEGLIDGRGKFNLEAAVKWLSKESST